MMKEIKMMYIKGIKTISILVLTAILMVSGVGCSSDAPREKVLDPNEPIKISVWVYYSGRQFEALNQRIAQFNETRGTELGIVVETNSFGSINDLEANVQKAFLSGEEATGRPNIFASYPDNAYMVDQVGEVVSFSDYFTEKELAGYIDSYIEEGRSLDGENVKILPVAKATDLLYINKTDWDKFAEAMEISEDKLATFEGITEVSEKYYNWTDAMTPEPEDGKALFGLDSMANYHIIGAKQLGNTIIRKEEGKVILTFDKDTMRRLWDNFYIPYINGYFGAFNRFRSDDVKTGNVLMYIGSSASAAYFQNEVVINDTEIYPIELKVLPAPIFEGGKHVAVQQGAGMVVAKATEAEVEASMEFLKWFTDDERNLDFSVLSGYMPVKKALNNTETISESEIDGNMKKALTVAVNMSAAEEFYVAKPWKNGTNFRTIIENSMKDIAFADRETVVKMISQGMTREKAVAEFVTDAYFEQWYEETKNQLESLLD